MHRYAVFFFVSFDICGFVFMRDDVSWDVLKPVVSCEHKLCVLLCFIRSDVEEFLGQIWTLRVKSTFHENEKNRF